MLFTFPSQYWYTIGLLGVFSLAGWSPRFQTGFLVSRPTQDSSDSPYSYLYGIVTLFDVPFQTLPILYDSFSEVLLPRICRNNSGLGSFRFARHYSGNRYFFLFLRVMRCFSSPGWPHPSGRCHAFSMTGCPIQICTDQILFADPRAFSQLTTSFFASRSLGILCSPFVTSSCESFGIYFYVLKYVL